MIVYETKNKTLWKNTKLTVKENQLLIALSSNKFISNEELKRILEIRQENLRTLVCRLRNKTDLNIKNIAGRGYKLEDEIYFEKEM